MMILVERNQVVIPGETLARGSGIKTEGPVYRREVNGECEICASMVGLVQKPRKNVVVTSWNVDIRGPYVGALRVGNVIDRDFDPLRESLDQILQVGDIIKAQITYFDRTRDPVLTLQGRGLRKISAGRVIEVDPVKVPRIIGKKGSMIQLLKNMTNTSITVGQNGRIIITTQNIQMENLIERAIRKIEEEAHTSGLTDRIRDFLEIEKRKLLEGSKEDE
jgi:exosome complex component RRP4